MQKDTFLSGIKDKSTSIKNDHQRNCDTMKYAIQDVKHQIVHPEVKSFSTDINSLTIKY